jgi:sigma-B regulation protein RsbQ
MKVSAARNNVQESGVRSGPPIVFAHGYGCDQAMWRYVVPFFQDRYRVILFDHVGFGQSDATAWSPVRHGTLQGYSADLLELLHDLEITGAVLVGHSVAAMIGVLAAVEEPTLFRDLIMVCPSPRYIDDPSSHYVGGFSAVDIEDLIATLEANQLGWSAAMAATTMGNPDRPELGNELYESFCRLDPKVASVFARATFTADNRSDLARLRTRTLILQCSEDVIAPREVGAYVHKNVVGSTFVELKATGHCPNLSAPAETAAAIRAYLDAHDSA